MTNKKQKIALLIPICSRGRNFSIDNYPLKDHIFSSFDFENNEYDFKIFLGSDHDDEFFTREDVKIDMLSFSIDTELEYYNDTSNNPVRVWNHLFRKAYDEGFDYFYQLGDDIEIITKNSIGQFINALQELKNIGVVGPIDKNLTNHRFHSQLLTQSFVHRTHMDIFGFYYPHEFTNWYCDNWIQGVYGPHRKRIFKEIFVCNSGRGERYEIKRVPRMEYVKFVERDKQILNNYINDNS